MMLWATYSVSLLLQAHWQWRLIVPGCFHLQPANTFTIQQQLQQMALHGTALVIFFLMMMRMSIIPIGLSLQAFSTMCVYRNNAATFHTVSNPTQGY